MSKAFWSKPPTKSYNYDTTMDIDEHVAYNDKDVSGQINLDKTHQTDDDESSDHLSDDMEGLGITKEKLHQEVI